MGAVVIAILQMISHRIYRKTLAMVQMSYLEMVHQKPQTTVQGVQMAVRLYLQRMVRAVQTVVRLSLLRAVRVAQMVVQAQHHL
ncbi:hypothetical protein D3C75_996180 [compost metagenome]